MNDLGTMTIEDAAKTIVGNWKQFESFAWHRRHDIPDADQWCVVYTHNRDSDLLTQSNAAAIDKMLAPFRESEDDDPDCVSEHHAHWACGWIDGYSIRVYRDGQVTPAFRAYWEICEALAGYPVLDESDYSEREYNDTLSNIEQEARGILDDYEELPQNWASEVYSWLWDNDQSAVHPRDGFGGYPDRNQIRAAFDGLGWQRIEEPEEA